MTTRLGAFLFEYVKYYNCINTNKTKDKIVRHSNIFRFYCFQMKYIIIFQLLVFYLLKQLNTYMKCNVIGIYKVQ